MTPRISLLFAALHVLLYLWLTARVVMRRRAAGIGLGAGGDAELARRVRVHGNFSEYVPLGLLMLALLELAAVPAALLWGLGSALLLGRLLHAQGLAGSAGVSSGRLLGAALTFATLAVMALAGLWRVLAPMLV